MTTEESKRKLAAILSADVKGYSRLMSQDEEATVKTLKQHRLTFSGLVSAHGGRVVDSPGDNILAEFGSVVDAVKCAVKVQETLKGENADLPENRRMEFRIGVNLGDVIEEEERIYGDGVNIAARMEGLAEAGGICISGTAFDHVKNKLSVGYQYLGEQTVKNIPDPVRAYKVLMEPEAAGKVIGEKEPKERKWGWKSVAAIAVLFLVASGLVWNAYWRGPKIERASREKMVFPLPDKPSIVVLPFLNMSEDPKQEVFSDGITEEIINALSKLPQVFVIARNSSFTYKGKPVKVQKVAEEFGVQYVLEGSVRREENRFRITAQLIDALTGRHVFSERYDRDIKDIFATQDEVAIKVLTALRVALKDGQWARVQARGVSNVEAYFKLQEAFELSLRVNKDSNAQARRLAEEALSLEPGSSRAYQILAMTHFWDYWLGSTRSPDGSITLGIEMANRAIALDQGNLVSHGTLAMLYVNRGEYDKAIEQAERALSLDPDSIQVLIQYGSTLMHACRPVDAIPVFEKVLRLDPVKPASMTLSNLASCYRMTGRYEDSIRLFKRLLGENPKHWSGHVGLTITYCVMGREEEARAQANELLKADPKFFVERYRNTARWKDPVEMKRNLHALRKAGLPDNPPLPLPDKPSIAVLPFTNMSEDKGQEYFSDGLTEEIITALSKTPKLFVIARNSSFVYKDKSVNVQQVSRELGVKYVLEGSVRRSRDQLRITAQLIDATTGNHIWAERYDREMRDIFAIQDEITKKIITALQVELTQGEQARVYERGTKNIEAYLKALQAAEVGRRLNPEDNLKARRIAEEAIALDPNYASAYRELGATHLREVWLRIAKSPKESLERAAESAKKALMLDESLPPAHTVLGQVYLLSRQFDKAIAEGERVIELDPNGAESHWYLGTALLFSGRPKEAIQSLEKAIRLNPFTPSRYLHMVALSYWYLEQHEEAIKWGERAVERSPHDQLSNAVLTMCYSSGGRGEEAQAQTAKLLKINPKYCVGRPAGDRFKEPEADERYNSTLRKAGIPDCPSN